MEDDEDYDRRREKMTALARTFPTLVDAQALTRGSLQELNRWAVGPRSPGERLAAGSVLSLWDREAEWECGPFDVFESLARWDDEHCRAFARWAEDPWWP